MNGAQHGVWVGSATASSLSPIGPISLDGVRDPLGIVDPDASRVGDRIRLAYLSGFDSNERAICLADSEDGVCSEPWAWRSTCETAEQSRIPR